VQSRLLANLPHSARIIPIPVVSAIVGVFVLLVGPGEWFVLGWLRRRRWTWVTFPAIAAGCTLFTVRAAEYYLGTNDQQLALVITDFSPDGRALRENRLELWFAGRSGEAVSEMRQALAVPAGNEPPNPRAGAAQPGAIYQGLVPAHYTLRRRLSQWTPYLQRSLTFTPNPATAHLRWEALTKLPTYGFTAVPAAVTTTTYADPHAAEYIAKQIGADGWAVSVFQFGKLASGFRVPGGGDALAMLLSVGPISPYSPRRGIRKDAAVTPEPWTTAISPSGQPDLLDLLLDHAKADWVVVAERQVGREIQIQRCVYRFDSDD
jgi:hypothetical protein